VIIFKEDIYLRQFIPSNPKQWLRYVGVVNSQNISGETRIAFLLEHRPGKVWIDNVELYEGRAPVGLNQAELIYNYYNYIYVSPDMISPVMFTLKHRFTPEARPDNLKLILELPEEVSMESYYARYSADMTEKCSLSTEKIKKEEKTYTRYTISFPVTRNEFHRFRSGAGRTYPLHYFASDNLHCYLKTELKERNLPPAYYYANWDKGSQEPVKVYLKIIRVPRIKPLRRFKVGVMLTSLMMKYWPQAVENVKAIGANRIERVNLKDVERLYQDFSDIWADINLTQTYKNDPDTRGVGLDGKRGNYSGLNIGNIRKERATKLGYCMSYRGKEFQKVVEIGKEYIDKGVYRFRFDDEVHFNCFGDKCIDAFKEFLKQGSNLSYQDPRSFVRKAGSYPEHVKMWVGFGRAHYARAIKDLKQRFEDYRIEKGLKERIVFTNTSFSAADEGFEDAIDALAGAFEENMDQLYINCYFLGTAKEQADRLAMLSKKLKGRGLAQVPVFGSGLLYMGPSFCLDPHAIMKYQLLEAVFSTNLAGYGVWHFHDDDLNDLRYMAEANRIISRIEDILIDGQNIDKVKLLSGQGNVRAKRYKGETVILVSDYSTYEAIPLKVDLRYKVESPMKVTDIETGEVVTTLSPTQSDFSVILRENRARVLVVSPQ